MSSYDYKLKVFLEDQIQQLSQPNILEFGVREGRSTKVFLDLCRKKEANFFLLMLMITQIYLRTKLDLFEN